jgi:hypothetical protein
LTELEDNYKSFTVRFADKSVWNELKDDLKTTLKENEIKFQYSEKTPNFFIYYKSADVNVRITWEDESLLFSLQANEGISPENVFVCSEIYDLLLLFSGKLIEGISPYEW